MVAMMVDGLAAMKGVKLAAEKESTKVIGKESLLAVMKADLMVVNWV